MEEFYRNFQEKSALLTHIKHRQKAASQAKAVRETRVILRPKSGKDKAADLMSTDGKLLNKVVARLVFFHSCRDSSTHINQ